MSLASVTPPTNDMSIFDPVDYRLPVLADQGEKMELASLLSGIATNPRSAAVTTWPLFKGKTPGSSSTV